MISDKKRTTKEKVELFMNLFQGLPNVYGTYSSTAGRYWQVKEKITETIILNHLTGKQSYGFYPLIGDRTKVGVADFDHHNPEPPMNFIQRAKHYGINAYLEKSKSKGYHVWIFCSEKGVPARKLRKVMKYILDEIDSPDTEIFPKQDSIIGGNMYGNFINAPLFGKFIPEGKTVFIHEDNSLKPYTDQWEFLETIERSSEEVLDSIIDLNNLREEKQEIQNNVSQEVLPSKNHYGLPICARRILSEGVTFDQRIACFRIAVHLKRIGLPEDITIAVLILWRSRNQPSNGKGIISENEVKEQVNWVYRKNYRSYGCNESVVKQFCDKSCWLYKYRRESI